jgi:hypothetical protein
MNGHEVSREIKKIVASYSFLVGSITSTKSALLEKLN